ncbi:MAG: deoxyribose-phosphate aldolase [Phycisphaeraceae bacterium]|nr:deoxyribose-phosphate aldolase [Phycisphaeraceae bacterium]
MDLASRIDHTILKPEATPAQVQSLVEEAKTHHFASVCVNGAFVADVARSLKGSGVLTCAVVGFPLGAGKASAKAIEATIAIKDGADEIDFVAHLPTLLSKDVRTAKQQYMEIVRAARSARAQTVIKVIVESAVLMQGVDAKEAEARIEAACQAVRESGCDFIKTSTGFHAAGGASVEAVRLMKKHSHGLYVKASGGIRTYDDAKKMLDAGADRLGCSASVAIIEQARKNM